MSKDMFDENGILKPEYELTDSQKNKFLYNDIIEKNDYRTDSDKGIYFKGDDGKEYPSMDDVRIANDKYWERKMTYKPDENNKEELIEYAQELYEKYLNVLEKIHKIDIQETKKGHKK